MKEEDKKKLDARADKAVKVEQAEQQAIMLTPPLIDHVIDGEHIRQRPKDGYINATEMCKTAGKRLNDYTRNSGTTEFIEELSSVAGIPATELVQTIQGGPPQLQGTWVHPDVAVNLGQWLSPKFAVWVSKWINEWMRGNVSGLMPPHVQRYIMNKSKVPPSHFSMLNEIYLELLAPLDDARVRIPSSMMPDISTGRMFSNFLRDQGIDVGDFPTYEHEFPDGRIVYPRLYPLEYLSPFRRWLYNEWLPKRAIGYFSERFPAALPYIKPMLPKPKEDNDE